MIFKQMLQTNKLPENKPADLALREIKSQTDSNSIKMFNTNRLDADDVQLRAGGHDKNHYQLDNAQMSFSDDNTQIMAQVQDQPNNDPLNRFEQDKPYDETNNDLRIRQGQSAQATQFSKKQSMGLGGTGGGFSQFGGSSSEFMETEFVANDQRSPLELPMGNNSPKSNTVSAGMATTKPLGKSLRSSVISQSGATQNIPVKSSPFKKDPFAVKNKPKVQTSLLSRYNATLMNKKTTK